MADPIADLSRWSPPMRRRLVDGDVVVEKLSPLPTVMMIDLAGNSIGLPVSNGMANRSPTDPYRQLILAEKIAGGMVQVGRCPLGVSESTQHLPPAVRYQLDDKGKPDPNRPKPPCTRSAEGGKITAESPCSCIGALKEHRQAKHKLGEDKREERTNRLAKLQERTATANLDATTQLAAAAQALAAAGQQRGKDRDK